MTKSTRALPDASAPRSLEEVLDLIRGRGGRVTASRRLLLEVLFAAPGHHSVEELAQLVQAAEPEVHLSTIYRNVEELERLGVLEHSHLGHGPATYHLTTGAHTHFVCEDCGTSIEAPDALFEHLATEALERYGFAINPHHFAIVGRCASCR